MDQAAGKARPEPRPFRLWRKAFLPPSACQCAPVAKKVKFQRFSEFLSENRSIRPPRVPPAARSARRAFRPQGGAL